MNKQMHIKLIDMKIVIPLSGVVEIESGVVVIVVVVVVGIAARIFLKNNDY